MWRWSSSVRHLPQHMQLNPLSMWLLRIWLVVLIVGSHQYWSVLFVYSYFSGTIVLHIVLCITHIYPKKKITIICKIHTFNGRSKTVLYVLKLFLKHNPILLYSLALLFSNFSHLQLFLTCYYEFVGFHTMYVNY